MTTEPTINKGTTRSNNKSSSSAGPKKDSDEEPRRPDTCVTARHRYSWRKWIACWRKTKKLNEQREKITEPGKFKPDKWWPKWTPEWRKRKGWMWELDLASNWDELLAFEERENAKKEFGGRPMYVDYNDPDDDEIWENMSDPRQEYSSDESFNSLFEYDSDF